MLEFNELYSFLIVSYCALIIPLFEFVIATLLEILCLTQFFVITELPFFFLLVVETK